MLLPECACGVCIHRYSRIKNNLLLLPVHYTITTTGLVTSHTDVEEVVSSGSSLLTSGFITHFAWTLLESWCKIFKPCSIYWAEKQLGPDICWTFLDGQWQCILKPEYIIYYKCNVSISQTNGDWVHVTVILFICF